jgi:6-phosphogluconolactonase
MSCIANFNRLMIKTDTGDESGIRIFASPNELAEKSAEVLADLIKGRISSGGTVSIALSGGSTPAVLYSVLGDHYAGAVDWRKVHFFWGDERCVAPDSPDSNYGMVYNKLLKKIPVPESNIHRVFGENTPEVEAVRYSSEVARYTRQRHGLPCFDIVILGVGEDGHTASIFPSCSHLFHSERICEVALHPETAQKRITLTGRVLNNADFVAFLVTGIKKAEILRKIIRQEAGSESFPASWIIPSHGRKLWFLDKDAASLLPSSSNTQNHPGVK